MKSRLTDIGAGPLGLGQDQANAGAAGVVVNLPIGVKEGVDVLILKEVRRAMRAVQHADVPMVCNGGDQGARCTNPFLPLARCGQMQHVTHTQSAACMPTKLPQGKGAAATQVKRHIDAAAYGDGNAATRVLQAAHTQDAACPHPVRLPHGHGHTIDHHGHWRPRHGHNGVGMELQRRAAHGAFQRGRIGRVAHQGIGHTVCIGVHRA